MRSKYSVDTAHDVYGCERTRLWRRENYYYILGAMMCAITRHVVTEQCICVILRNNPENVYQ